MTPAIQISGAAGGLDNYVRAIQSAGGLPRPGVNPAADLTCQGLLLCGGGDIDPAHYGQPSMGSQPPDPARDRAELALIDAFWRAGRPILGICRGIQVLNVWLGGELIQDLPPEKLPHHQIPRGDAVHPISTAPDSLLAHLFGPRAAVNSAHHQALSRLGRGLRATAWSPDGVVEGVELPGRPVLGVQFHPERMAFAMARPDAADAAPLFSWLLARCRQE